MWFGGARKGQCNVAQLLSSPSDVVRSITRPVPTNRPCKEMGLPQRLAHIKQQLLAALHAAPWFTLCEADIVRIAAANPSNEFPLLLRLMQSRNVVLMQAGIGRIRGLADLSPAFLHAEAASVAFPCFVTHQICMIKGAVPNAGARPDHTLNYDVSESTLKAFCSGDRDKFLATPFLELACSIKRVREQLIAVSVPFDQTMFENAEVFGILKNVQHFLDAFFFVQMGPGSWGEA